MSGLSRVTLGSMNTTIKRSPAFNSSGYHVPLHDFSMPDVWPTFPTHSQTATCRNLAIDQLGLRDQITFGVEILRATPDTKQTSCGVSSGEDRLAGGGITQ